MGLLADTALYVVVAVIFFGVSLGAYAWLRAKHPKERNEGFLWAEAERIGGWILGIAFVGGLLFITLKFS